MTTTVVKRYPTTSDANPTPKRIRATSIRFDIKVVCDARSGRHNRPGSGKEYRCTGITGSVHETGNTARTEI